MLIGIARRFTGSLLAMSLTVMALSACASGPMTMAEMIYCAEHHDDCDMAGQAESCCAPDLQSDMGVLVAAQSDTNRVASVSIQMADTQPPLTGVFSTLRTSAFVGTRFALDVARSRPQQLNTVLLI